jgi:hypothetical protein
MRRRFFPNLVGATLRQERRLQTVEAVMRIIGFSPEQPYTLNVNDGTRNKVQIGKINGEYGIKIVNNSGNTIVFADGHITADGITTGTLDASVVTVTNLDASEITTGTLSADYISGGSIDANDVTINNIHADKITVGTFTNPDDRFDNGSLSGVKITDGTIVANKLEAHTITANYIASGAITTSKLDAEAVNADKIAANAVTAVKINASAVTSDKIDTGAVTANKISADTIEAGHIKANAVTTNKINGLAVTNSKIANTTITNAKIDYIYADKITAGTLTVGSGGADAIYIKRQSGDPGTGAFLRWEGNTRIWSDTSNRLGINSIGSPSYFYVDSYERLTIPSSGQTTIRDGAYLDGNVNITGAMACNSIRLNHNASENNITAINGLVGYNDIRYVLGSDAYYHSFANQSWGENAWITAGGSMELNGNLVVHGSKSFMIEHPENEDKYIRYTANESPEVALKIRGKDKLKNGKVKIKLPHHWELVTEENGLVTAQVTPLGDCKGLFVTKLRYNAFEVKECQNGKSNTEFCWEITATRKGFKDFEVEPTKEEVLEEKVDKIIEMENNEEEKPIRRSKKEMPIINKIYKRKTGKKYSGERKHYKRKIEEVRTK